MPEFIEPTFGSRYRWTGRRNSIVETKSKLFLPGKSASLIELRIHIHRRLWIKLFSSNDPRARHGLVEVIVSGLHEIASKLPHRGRHRVSLKVTPGRMMKIAVEREYQQSIRDFFSTASPKELSWLREMVWLFFLLGAPQRILRSARGARAGGILLGDYLPSSYFECQRLVVLSRFMPEIRSRIDAILARLYADVPNAAAWIDYAETQIDSRREQIETMLLVYWGFGQAWDRYNVAGLQEPRELFRWYLYGKPRRGLEKLDERLESMFPGAGEIIFRRSCQLFLSATSGAAAKAYRLI